MYRRTERRLWKLHLSAAEYNNKSYRPVENPLAVDKNLDGSLYGHTIYMFYYILYVRYVIIWYSISDGQRRKYVKKRHFYGRAVMVNVIY